MVRLIREWVSRELWKLAQARFLRKKGHIKNSDCGREKAQTWASGLS